MNRADLQLITAIYRKFLWIGFAMLAVTLIGTFGYKWIGGDKATYVDALYMTFITFSTIGYGEIFDMSGNDGARIFTMFIAVAGIGVLAYFLSSMTAFFVGGELREVFRRRKMEKMIDKFKDHFIVCGVDGVGAYIVHELRQTQRPHVIVDVDKEKIDRHLGEIADKIYIVGDATDDATLQKTGIEHARGIFAVTGNDNVNLVICLTAKQMNPRIRIVARCSETRNIDKMKKAGADSVVSPTFIGGLRIASEMVRPAVVSFLDTMMRSKDKNLRIEEVNVPSSCAGISITDLEIKKYPNLLLLAVKSKDRWAYNPPRDSILQDGDVLIFMTTPEERFQIESIFANARNGGAPTIS